MVEQLGLIPAEHNGAERRVRPVRSGSQSRQNAALPVCGSRRPTPFRADPDLGRRGTGWVREKKRLFRKHIGAEHDGSAVSAVRNWAVPQKFSMRNGGRGWGGAAQTRVSFEE